MNGGTGADAGACHAGRAPATCPGAGTAFHPDRGDKVPQARCTHSLPNRPESVRKARAWLRAILTAHGHDDAVDPALLIMSELVTNAVRHATQSATIEILCELDPDILTLSVIDHDIRQPVILEVTSDDERGRGLILISSISDEWGCHPHTTGKLVFARLKLEPRFPTGDLEAPRIST
jgi:anti-sigma regulatory factor (Ser/Thr protein kinase)